MLAVAIRRRGGAGSEFLAPLQSDVTPLHRDVTPLHPDGVRVP